LTSPAVELTSATTSCRYSSASESVTMGAKMSNLKAPANFMRHTIQRKITHKTSRTILTRADLLY
jgi:hypothetical protein